MRLHRYSPGWIFRFRWGLAEHLYGVTPDELEWATIQVHRFSFTIYRDTHTRWKWKLLKDFNAHTRSLKWFSAGCPLTKQGVLVRVAALREAIANDDKPRCAMLLTGLEALAENTKEYRP